MSLDSPPTLNPTEVNSALASAKASNPDLYQRMLATLTPEEIPQEYRADRPAIDASHVGNSGDDALMAEAFKPAADIADYMVNGGDANLSTALLAMQFPPAVGKTLGEQGLADARRYQAMTPAEQGAYKQEQLRLLGAAGIDATAALKNADAMAALIDPKIGQALFAAGFFTSARVVAAMHLQALRLAAKAGK
jgi:hypothetical protein